MRKKYKDKLVFFVLLPLIAFLIEIIGSDYDLAFIQTSKFLGYYITTLLEVIIAWFGIRLIINFLDRRTKASKDSMNKRLSYLFVLNLVWYSVIRILIHYFELFFFNEDTNFRILINSGIPVEVLFIVLLNLLYLYWGQHEKKAMVNQESNIISKDRPDNAKYVEIKLTKKTIFVKFDEIAYVYIIDSISYLVTSKNEIYNIDYSLNSLQDILDNKSFYRVNRQFLINQSAIQSYHVLPNRQIQINLSPVSKKNCLLNKNNVTNFKTWLTHQNRIFQKV